MAAKFVSERNLKFLLYEVFDTIGLTQYDYYKDHNRKMFDMVLKEAIKLAKELFLPVFTEMDREQPELVDGEVQVHPSVRTILQKYAEGGWMTSALPYDMDGDQIPFSIVSACGFIFSAANYSAAAYVGLTTGSAHLITSFGGKELQDIYVPRMYSGEWQGTMALTEPEAGSSLTDITTSAEPAKDGHYLIKGQKIFISAGDHNAVENVVHLMLAKIKGGPPGVKGISLFVVPKKRLDDNGELISNDIITSGIYHKMGYKGCPLTQLNLGDKNDCRGWLVGEPHNGLRYMFQMMNELRIEVGMGAAALASAAYYATLDYAKNRLQGRKIGAKDPTQPQIPIVQHADIKRMLLFQRAVVDGSLSLLAQCARYVDLQAALPDGEEKENAHLLLELLTPVAKTFPSEMGVLSISQGLQCFGGSGYCDDYPLEQYLRDARIHPIHEGTTGIQGMDLLGRKVVMHNGKAFMLFLTEVGNTIEEARQTAELGRHADQLASALETLQEVTRDLLALAQEKGPEVFLADATLYLELFGIVTIAWQWLLQGIAVQKALKKDASKSDTNFYEGKMYTLRYFFAYELPKIRGLATRLLDRDAVTVEMEAHHFSD